MIILNHQHLYYFWMVAREGSISKASQKLFLGQPTVSTQIIQLEKALGTKLFNREKKQLVLPNRGALRSAMPMIFSAPPRNSSTACAISHRMRIYRSIYGIDASVSKQIMVRLIETIYLYKPNAHVTVHEGAWPDLLEGLQTHALHVVLSEQGRAGTAAQETFPED